MTRFEKDQGRAASSQYIVWRSARAVMAEAISSFRLQSCLPDSGDGAGPHHYQVRFGSTAASSR